MKTLSFDSSLGKYILSKVQKYDHVKYWKRRDIVVNNNNVGFIKKLIYLYYIKKIDSWHNCSFGTNINSGANFKTPPNLPHGPNGIIVGHDVVFGSNCTIFHQVTVAHGGSHIGDDVLIGAGAKIMKGCNVGSQAKIGANCVVIEDIPSKASVVLQRPRIIFKD